MDAKRAMPRITKQRKAIFQALEGDTSHPTADEIFQRVKQELPSISLATVYRNLKLLADAGLILEISTPDGPNRFDPQTHRHYHFMCERCERVDDVELPVQQTMERQLERSTSYKVHSHELIFYGICPNCQS